MGSISIAAIVIAYFILMFAISWYTGRKTKNSEYFRGNRKVSWVYVAIAMIGSSMSGVSFVSVPGMVAGSGFSYLQMCIGFFIGYLVIAFVLTPLFFRLNVISIYQYLENRFGTTTYKTGAWFFFISKLLGASVRLYLVCLILQLLVFSPLHLPFILNVTLTCLIVYAYTFKGGVKSVLGNDVLKTVCMLASIILTIIYIGKESSISLRGMADLISRSEMSQIFYFGDYKAPLYFWKQVAGGLFAVVAMTGLDQDMMQRTLSCKNYKDSQKNLITSSVLQIVVIFMFLCLGVMLYIFARNNGIQAEGDKLFPTVATSGLLPAAIGGLFLVGLLASSYSSGGSALTSLTTSATVDLLGIKGKSETQITRTRMIIQAGISLATICIILIFNHLNNNNAIVLVYSLASYTYGPILGMFAFGIMLRRNVREKFIPLVAIASPIMSYALQYMSESLLGYKFSYELLVFNAMFTFIGMLLISKQSNLEK